MRGISLSILSACFSFKNNIFSLLKRIIIASVYLIFTRTETQRDTGRQNYKFMTNFTFRMISDLNRFVNTDRICVRQMIMRGLDSSIKCLTQFWRIFDALRKTSSHSLANSTLRTYLSLCLFLSIHLKNQSFPFLETDIFNLLTG